MRRRGHLEEIIYRNEDNGYTVAFFEGEEESMMVVGYLQSIHEGEAIEIEGSLKEHPRYGEQFVIEKVHFLSPSKSHHVRNFLASGKIHGIGEVLAGRLVNHFGEKTLDVLEHEPRRFLEVEGIGEKTLERILASYGEIMERRESLLFLQEIGITGAAMARILSDYQEETRRMIEENPYRLYLDYPCLGFERVDRIARELGFSESAFERIHASVLHLLYHTQQEGHLYLPEDELFQALGIRLNLDRELLEERLREMIRSGLIVEEERRYYLFKSWKAESTLAMDFSRLLRQALPDLEERDSLTLFERKCDLHLEDRQREALQMALSQGVSIITGGPGTGKTTLIQALCSVAEDQKLSMALCAPTGRASKRMEEMTGKTASTIHRLLEFQYSEDEQQLFFLRNRDNPLEYDIIVLDEASMVDLFLMSSLLEAIEEGTRLVILGDADQLPPVGPGKVLHDLIDSDVVPVTRLQYIFRQSEKSLIPLNARRVMEGVTELSSRSEGDFFFLRESSSIQVLKRLEELIMKRLPGYEGIDVLRDIQVLTPMKKGPLGTVNVNQMLQGLLQPEGEALRGFRLGDKVMQTRNDYHLSWRDVSTFEEGSGIFNGDIGEITAIDFRHRECRVLFDRSREVLYGLEAMEHLEHAYAMTIHKSQGSEFPCVIVLLGYVPEVLRNRQVIYTAMTRAKKLLIFLGSSHSLQQMIQHQECFLRYTSLKERLMERMERSSCQLGNMEEYDPGSEDLVAE